MLTLAKHRQDIPILPHIENKRGCTISSEHLWTILDTSGQLHTSLDSFRHLWIVSEIYGHLLKHMDTTDHLWILSTPGFEFSFTKIPSRVLNFLLVKYEGFVFSFNKTPRWSTPGF